MKALAIVVAKILAFIGSLNNRGSVTPGAVALRISPKLMDKIVLPKIKIVVTGSSGKGSTSLFVAEALRSLGLTVVHNQEGSNMKNGIVTMLLKAASLSGRVKADALVAEIDERSCKYTFSFLKPDFVVITNITRDQPPRQRHTDFIYSEIKQALSGSEHLVLNGDDPLLMRFSLVDEASSMASEAKAPKVTTYGISADSSFKSADIRFNAVDAVYCPVCASRLDYDYYINESSGSFHCLNGHLTHRLDVAVTAIERGEAVDGSADRLIVDSQTSITANSRLLFNISNVMAAYTTVKQLSLPVTDGQIAAALSEQTVSKKIFESYRWQGRQAYVLNNKAENASTFNQSVLFAAGLKEQFVLVVGWKEISRRYDFDDLAWLYDVNFDLLAEQVTAAICTGIDASTIAVRLKYAGVPAEQISCFDDMDERVSQKLESTSGTIVAILNFDHVGSFVELTGKG
ncbi:MAG: MurT ligase domain-containing protein [Coriobacteriia bacterium]|nr:MurT ligase domain-containing protein [Coriobacteriia bacterium]